ncbi:MAG: ABC transporter ATP-binding protein [Wenzhouxiangella sp.]
MSSASPSILQCRQVGFSVQAPGGNLEILNDISLNLNAGETLAIVGASGSGKTTLLGLLAGLEHPTRGEIWLAGSSLNQLDENERARLRRRQVGFVFQSFHLLPSLTALENVMLALEIAGLEQPRQRAETALDQVGLAHRMQHYPRQMSGGEQQRVAIARAFSGRPAILFADEPTGNLDRHTGQAIADLLFGINREHQTALVLVTHDLNLAQRCGRIEQIEDGRFLDPSEAEGEDRPARGAGGHPS